MSRIVRWVSYSCLWSSVIVWPVEAATLPPGFVEFLVAGTLQSPTAMDLAPDGRLFICEQGGRLRVIKDGVLLPTPFLTVPVDATGERGLLGVAFDPAFDQNAYVYVYYTATSPTTHNRVSRFTADGDVALVGSEVVILELEDLGARNHNGGAIHFGVDEKLYVAVGENGHGPNSQTLENRLGKMLRINPDGTIPPDNPFYAIATGANRAIWALGLRNPFTFSIQPITGVMFINDVGQNTWEEINEGLPGANYGWPITEGPTDDPRFISPLYAYDHSNGCAISGGAFYDPATNQFPAEFESAYFFADLCGGWIRRRDPGTGAVSEFATGIPSPVDLKVTDDGGLYYLARGSGAATGVVYRIEYTPAIPSVDIKANGSDGPVGLAPADPLAVSLVWDAGSQLTNGEVYFGVFTPFGLLWFDPGTGTFVPTLTRAYAGPLPDFGPVTLVNLPNVASLPSGGYWWFAVVDRDLNGVPNGDFVDVVVTIVF